MPSTADNRFQRSHLREGLLLLGFALVLTLAVVTVVLPELSREPDSANAGRPTQATGRDGDADTRSD